MNMEQHTHRLYVHGCYLCCLVEILTYIDTILKPLQETLRMLLNEG